MFSIKTTARIFFVVMVKGRSSLLLSPRNSRPREQNYDFLCWNEWERIAAFSTGKKKYNKIGSRLFA